MSSRRQATIGYYLGIDGRNYVDSTIFNITKELITYEQLSIGYSQREQWGNIFTSITFSNFLKDFSKNNLNMTASVQIRIWRGLSWNTSASFSFVNDDVNIAKKEVRPEDLLLGTRQLSTSKSLRFNTGISLTFGSMYNNVVNTRLGVIQGWRIRRRIWWRIWWRIRRRIQIINYLLTGCGKQYQ